MTSEIRTNSLTSRAGLSTVTMTDTGPIISGVTTANNFKTGSSDLHSTGLTVGNTLVHSTGLNVGTGATVHSPASNVLTLGTNSNERLRITSGGKVNIGSDTTTNTSFGLSLRESNARIEVVATNNSNSGIYLRTFNSGSQVSNATLRTDNSGKFQIYNGTTSDGLRFELSRYGYVTLDSGSQGNDSKPGIELKSSGYTGNITKLFQDSPNAESYLQTTERPLIIDVDSTNETSSSRLQVNIDGDEKVRITSDGYILTAQQVGCAVRMSSNFTHPGNANFNQGSNWVMPFDTEVWDIGGNFNTSNYTFTAPVAGRYLCCYTIQLESISNWLWNYVYPVVTGTGGNTNTVASAAAGVVFSDDAGNGVTGNSTTTAQYHTFTNTVVMNLTAGQAVRMGVRGNMTATIKSGAESQWTMQLLG